MKGKSFLITLIFSIGFLFSVSLAAQEMVFSAQADVRTVGINDVFQVSFILKNTPQSTQYKPPSFSNFIIRGGPSQSQSSQISSINGQTQQTSTIQLTYALQAQKVGKLKIEPLEVIIGDTHYFTNALTIEVVEGSVARNPNRGQQPRRNQSRDPFADDDFWQQQDQSLRQMMQQLQQFQQRMMGNMPPGMMQNPQDRQDLADLDEKNLKKNIFIKVEVDKTKPYVGEQITAKYKLYTRLNMNMSLTQLPSLNGFWSEDFKIANPPQPTIEEVNGRKFNVFLLKKSALFPQQSGKLILDPAKAEGNVQVIDFSDSRFGYQPKNVYTTLSSVAIPIEVRPLPHPPDNFTGAVGNFTIQAVIDSTILYTDKSALLKIIITGTGNLKLIGAPTTEFPKSLGASEPQVEDTILSRSPSISGRKIFTYFLNPEVAGEMTIPPVQFSYFDPATNEYHTLHTDAIKIKVNQGRASEKVVNNRPGDIHEIEKGVLKIQSSSFNLWTASWYWALYIIGILISIVLLILHSRNEKALADLSGWKNKRANKIAWKRLSQARKLLKEKNAVLFYEEISKAIWLYLSDKLNIPLSELSKLNISEQLALKNIDESKMNKVNRLLAECEMALYSPSGGQQQRHQVLTEASSLISSLEDDLKSPSKVLKL